MWGTADLAKMPAVLGATESLPLPRGLKGDAPGTTAGRCWAGQDQGEARTEGHRCRPHAHLRCSSSCAYRKWTSARLARISAWQSLTTSPWSLMCSPLMHFVPEDRTTTWACLVSRPGGQKRHQSPWPLPSPWELSLLSPSASTPPPNLSLKFIYK